MSHDARRTNRCEIVLSFEMKRIGQCRPVGAGWYRRNNKTVRGAMEIRRAAIVALSGLVIAAAAAAVASWRPAIEPAPPPGQSSFAPAEVAAGARLALLGDCAVCHVGVDGRAYAGGTAVATPFGAIHAPNITPDPDTGIGRWSLAAFHRAMTEGV